MNDEIFLTSLAIGGITKLITLKRPTPGRQISTAAGLIIASVLLAILVPESGNYTARLVLIAWALMDILGEYAGLLIDKYRVRKEAKGWQRKTDAKPKTRQ